MSNVSTRCLTQKTKKWKKVKKIKTIEKSFQYLGRTILFTVEEGVNSKNRDRMGGHKTETTTKLSKDDRFGSLCMGKSRKFFKKRVNSQIRQANKAQILEGIHDYEDDLHAQWESYFQEEDEWYDWGLEDSKMYDGIAFIYENEFPEPEYDPWDSHYDFEYEYAY